MQKLTKAKEISIVVKRDLNKNKFKIPKNSLNGKGLTRVNWTGT